MAAARIAHIHHCSCRPELFVARVHRHLMGTNQDAVGTDAVGGAGHQGQQILIRHALEVIGLLRQHHLDLVHEVLQFVAGDLKVDDIAFFHVN